MMDKGYLSGEVEFLDLEDLQGVHGLNALRIKMELEGEISLQLSA